MDDSILISIKKLLGIGEDDEQFDPDILMHINSVFMILTQIGVGPESGFSIQDDSSKWADFVSDINKIEAIKSYIYLKVRLLFDPPTNSSTIEAINSLISELEWRLNVIVDTNV